MTIPLTIAITVAAPWIVEVVYGGRYDTAATVLAILCWSVPLLAVAVPYGTALLVADRQRT